MLILVTSAYKVYKLQSIIPYGHNFEVVTRRSLSPMVYLIECIHQILHTATTCYLIKWSPVKIWIVLSGISTITIVVTLTFFISSQYLNRLFLHSTTSHRGHLHPFLIPINSNILLSHPSNSSNAISANTTPMCILV